MPTTARTGYTKTDRAGAIAVAAGAAIWGLFWLPLRYLSDLGVSGLWAVSLVMSTAAVPSLLLMWQQKESRDLLRKDTWLTSVALAAATVLYFTGILYSDVIRVIFLFYLLPLWTTLSARLIYGEPITRAKLLVIATALCGLWLLLGGGTALPLPKNVGDWCGIAAGLCWGVSLSLLRGRAETRPFAVTSSTLICALILSATLASLLYLINADSVEPAAQVITIDWQGTLGLAGIFGALILFPAMLGQIWGARRIPAPTAALLTMTEILVATVSAGLIIGTDLPPIAWLGGAIIVLAVCIDLLAHHKQS
ncbi:DMT family transporter [Granulosicoccus antarcticus]|uniref:EamA domain-containing protein n=1 Tax=Granulosicoccus antarcticus IMCC3135 TaxID=1192854 RepID=A0A2Z2P299_9GAMM|nr:DMT family transporter [Granulosicoccus antarcticus]ASJ76721.1 hypothetical protein IMCC3135_33385 [Granulosicoccus antarcticus IMCC3135]